MCHRRKNQADRRSRKGRVAGPQSKCQARMGWLPPETWSCVSSPSSPLVDHVANALGTINPVAKLRKTYKTIQGRAERDVFSQDTGMAQKGNSSRLRFAVRRLRHLCLEVNRYKILIGGAGTIALGWSWVTDRDHRSSAVSFYRIPQWSKGHTFPQVEFEGVPA